jgi:hypothetical protein
LPDLNPPTPSLTRRRRRLVLGVVPMALASWVGLAGLPVSAPAATASAGTMHSTIITLTGDGAAATSAIGSGTRALRSAPATAKPGWSASLAVDPGTEAVAASWTGSPTGEVDVRGHGADGWSDWQLLQADPADGPDDSVRDAGGMAWFGRSGIDQVEVKVVEGNLADLQVQAMRYEEPEAPTGLTRGATADAAVAQPAILPRTLYTSKGWATKNSGCASGPTYASGGLKLAIVHHTVNANDYSEADVPAMLASIYAYHTGTNGWCDIAYNFIVDRFGRVWEGRSGGIDKAVIGGHAQGFNTGTMGVSFLGQFEPGASPAVGRPTAAALAAAGRVIGWKLSLFGTPATGQVTVTSGGSNRWPAGKSVTLNRISGHRDVGYTACPGQYLYDELGTIRSAAAATQAQNNGSTTTTAPPTTTTTTPPPPNQYAPFKSAWGLITQDYQDVLHRAATQSDIDYWAGRVANTWSPGQFTANLVVSGEADLRVDAVIRLYRAYFQRNPDHSGFTYWVNQRLKGRSLLSISSTFAGSSEFKGHYGSLGNAAFVDLVYRNVMGRPADAAGANYWVKKLANRTPRGQMMINFSQSNEYKAATADSTHVVSTYEAMLQRAIPSDEYTLYVSGLKSSGTSLTGIASSIYASSEYRARFA